MAKLLNWQKFERSLKAKRILLFSTNDICRLFGTTRIAATFLLHRYSLKGYVIRIKRGLYVFPDAVPPEPFIANAISLPSYVSLEFALSYHGVIPETVYEMTSITTKSTRRFHVLGKDYVYRSVRRKAFTGYATGQQQGFRFSIADAEKAFVDAAFFRMYDELSPLSRFDKTKLDPKKVERYAYLFHNEKLVRLLRTTFR